MADELQFLVHFNRTLCVSLSSKAATFSGIASLIQQREGVPSSLLDLYVNAMSLPSRPSSAPDCAAAYAGKGGFGAMLRSMGKSSGARATTDFGACRDLHGRRLRHVNQEVAMHKWRQDAETRTKREKDGIEDREVIDEETASGIPGWYLATPSWAEGIKKSFMKRRRNTVLCKSWVKAREGGKSPPPGAPRWWGCPRGRDCDFAHGEEELRGEGLTELKRAKRDETQRAKQQDLQDYVAFEQEMPDDVLDAIKSGLRRRKKKADVKIEQQEKDARVLPPDATTYISVRSAQRPLPVVEKWLKLVGSRLEDATASVGTTFKHGLCELRGRGNFVTAAARHCCALTKGKWYYEVRLVTAGVVQIGWADSTFEANSETGDGVGDHERSWAYDGARQVKWNGGKDEQYAMDDSWSKNDVVGCLLDLDEGTVSFTRNGVDLGVAFRNVKYTSSDRGFFPAISVEQTEILLVNIGSQPFLYEVPGFEPVIDALEAETVDEPATVGTTTSSTSDSTSGSEKSTSAAVDDTRKQTKASSSKDVKTETAEKKAVAPTEPPIDLMKFETVESLEALGLERLKQELSRRDLKCGGNLTERAARLLSVRGKAWNDIDAKLKIKNKAPRG
ncbi:Sde2 N-terminal domain [Phytophthora cactorum]|nr:Sde2 N-terminal domain [Phytophthora cactorum]